MVPFLKGAKHVFVMPHGPLQSLPFGILVREAASGSADYKDVAWLAKDYALTTLPSVSSLKVLRKYLMGHRAPKPFTGFGNPQLAGSGGSLRGITIPALYKKESCNVDALADVDAVRNLPALPDMVDELRALSSA